jgi:hypothetical protein
MLWKLISSFWSMEDGSNAKELKMWKMSWFLFLWKEKIMDVLVTFYSVFDELVVVLWAEILDVYCSVWLQMMKTWCRVHTKRSATF